jgi:hypothetical protein
VHNIERLTITGAMQTTQTSHRLSLVCRDGIEMKSRVERFERRFASREHKKLQRSDL